VLLIIRSSTLKRIAPDHIAPAVDFPILYCWRASLRKISSIEDFLREDRSGEIYNDRDHKNYDVTQLSGNVSLRQWA
jgi:hypothetical protein